MATADQQKMKTEMVVFLRNSDILSTAQRGVTTDSSVATATASQTLFTISHNVVRNIRYVTVNGASKSAYTDYTPDYKAASSTVTFLTGLTNGDKVDIGLDYSSGTVEKIWSDYPEIEYLPSAIPRVGFDIIAQRTEPLGIGDTNWLTDAMMTIKVYDSNLKAVDGYITTIRSKVKAAQRAFYHFPLITIGNVGPPLLHDFVSKVQNSGKARLAGKVFEKAIDLICRFNYES